jgi:hypothetical protein
MPELDPTSEYARLVQLAWEYQEIIDLADDPSRPMEEIQSLNSQRTVVHDEIIAELERLGKPVEDRESAMRFALKLARWMLRSENDYDV